MIWNFTNPLITRLQLLFSVLAFFISIICFCGANESSIYSLISMICLCMYHIIDYCRKQHIFAARKQWKYISRIEPLSLLLAAFIILFLSYFSHLNIMNNGFMSISMMNVVENESDLDFVHMTIDDPTLYMHHKFDHDRRHLLSDKIEANNAWKYNQEKIKQILAQEDMDIETRKKLEKLQMFDLNMNEVNSEQKTEEISNVMFVFLSLIISISFVIFFMLLNTHLSQLELLLIDLIFANGMLANVKNMRNNEIANENTNDINHGKPYWSSFLFAYNLIFIQSIGIFSFFIISILRQIPLSSLMYCASFLVLIGSECGIRCAMKLQLSHRPLWISHLLYFLFGSMVISNVNNGGNKYGIHFNRNIVKKNRGCCKICIGVFSHIPNFVQHLKDTQTSRRIFIFFSMNFLFMFVEFAYGYWSNSLGLMSDACHMLFDCIALFIGLLASYFGSTHIHLISQSNTSVGNDHSHSRNVDRYLYSFGHERIKVMAGFINAIFLVYIGFSVLIEAFERILHPHQIQTDQLLLVSVLGLLVNLVGLYFFHDAQLIFLSFFQLLFIYCLILVCMHILLIHMEDILIAVMEMIIIYVAYSYMCWQIH